MTGEDSDPVQLGKSNSKARDLWVGVRDPLVILVGRVRGDGHRGTLHLWAELHRMKPVSAVECFRVMTTLVKAWNT